jgi:hypothetical protein
LVVVQFQEPEVHPRELDSLRWMGVTGEERNDERRKFISSNYQFCRSNDLTPFCY